MPAIDTIAEARNAGVRIPSDPRAFTPEDMLRMAEFCEQRSEFRPHGRDSFHP